MEGPHVDIEDLSLEFRCQFEETIFGIARVAVVNSKASVDFECFTSDAEEFVGTAYVERVLCEFADVRPMALISAALIMGLLLPTMGGSC